MFKQLLYDKCNKVDEVSENIAMEIKNFYAEESNVIAKSFKYEFEIQINKLQHKKVILLYFIDKEKNTLIYKNFIEVIDDENADRLKEIGLGSFVIS